MSSPSGNAPKWLSTYLKSTIALVATAIIALISVFVIGERVQSATSSSTIVTCANNKTGDLRLLTRGSCNVRTETVLHWARKGFKGDPGEVGPTGPTGPSGPSGPTGPEGQMGHEGTQGITGLTGLTGPTGPMGPAGPVGAQGPQGPAGPGGAAGVSPADISNGFVQKYICGSSGTEKCVLGAVGPAGGTVIFIDFNNQYPDFDYRELAPIGWNGTSDDPEVAWCDNTTTQVDPVNAVYPYWKDRIQGQGSTNTNNMLAVCTTGAAVLVHNYRPTHNGVTYSDWALPALAGLMEVFNYEFGHGLMEGEVYWTSSEYSATKAWAVNFLNLDQPTLDKTELHAVRPSRKF